MYAIFSVGLEILAAAVVLIPVFFILNKVLFHDIRKTGLYCLFSFYLVAVYSLVGLPNITYIRFELNLQLIPFVPMLDYLANSVLNVILFVPLGFFLPILWRKYESGKATILFGLGVTLLVELLQILTYRATDINDVITNVTGSALGYCVAKLLAEKIPAVGNLIADKKDRDAYVVCGLVFVTMFFVQPFISSMVWEMALN